MSGKKVVPSLPGPTGKPPKVRTASGPTSSHTISSTLAELRKWQETQTSGLGIPSSHATLGTTGGVVMARGTQELGSGIPSSHATSGTPGGVVMADVIPGGHTN